MKMFRPALAGVLPAFALLVCIQLNARAAWTPPPDMQSWFTGDDALNHHIWQPVGTLYDGATYAAARVAAPSQSRQLLFEDRVAYQRAIEEVYWRHRIWPKERPDPKPSLNAVMSQATIEQKVEDYLRTSELLEEEWQKSITPEQLQAEMDRIAQYTKAPEVLRELFAALGNDPSVIAECLARPVLLERLQLATVEWRKEPLESWSATAQGQMPTIPAAANASYTLPAISNQPSECIVSWTATSTTNAPTARSYHTAVWTGSEMIVWGGYFYDGDNHFLNTGGRYNPITDSWTATGTTDAPTARYAHTAVWTGSEMIVWGGYFYDGDNHYLNTGGRYNPATNSWTATTTINAPTARIAHTAVWTGSEMIVWGGVDENFLSLNTGGLYDPATDSWIATNTTSAPEARSPYSAVWTESEMIIWGGFGDSGWLNTGGRYDPATDSWTATSTVNAPDARYEHTAVWAGNTMVVWGGNSSMGTTNTGGRYDPSTDSWTATSTINAPELRRLHTAVWTGSEMIVWGGLQSSTVINTGGRYDPATDSWTPTRTVSAPNARFVHTAVWTGSEMIVWGGDDENFLSLNTGGRYCPQADDQTETWTPTGSLNTKREFHTATLLPDGKVLAAGGGNPSTLASAELYDPASGTWTATGSMGIVREFHTATLLLSGKVLVAGGDGNLASAELYDPATGAWTSTGRLANRRESHTSTLLPSGKVLVAGGNGTLASAELYDPATGRWTATGSLAKGRGSHTATLLANGTVLVAGGLGIGGALASAELYDPSRGTWTTTGSLNTARFSSTATLLPDGKVLAAAGEDNNFSTLASAELYDPATGTWTTTGSLATARTWHTATLLPSGKVLAAAGYNGPAYISSAELYDPVTGTWTATESLASSRAHHTETLLSDGRVLVAAGIAGSDTLASAELYVSAKGGPITLSAAKRKVGGINTVRLTWSGATSTDIDVYRDAVRIVTTPNDGSHTDPTGDTGRARYKYRVCEAGTSNCSNTARARFPE